MSNPFIVEGKLRVDMRWVKSRRMEESLESK